MKVTWKQVTVFLLTKETTYQISEGIFWLNIAVLKKEIFKSALKLWENCKCTCNIAYVNTFVNKRI